MTVHHQRPTFPLANVPPGSGRGGSQEPQDLDVLKRDRFELLSAYLDGEVTPDERRLVQHWLAEDPASQCLYERLLNLRAGFQGLCHQPWPGQSGAAMAEGVVTRLEQRCRLGWMAGGMAVALVGMGVMSGNWGWRSRFSFSQTLPPAVSEPVLQVALDQPAIAIPVVAETRLSPPGAPQDSVQTPVPWVGQ